MSSCTACGHQLGVGRFCTHCGAPVDSSAPDGTPVSSPVSDPVSSPVSGPVTSGDWRTDTAERRLPRTPPAPDPRTPPSAVAPPPPPRYPLFADEVDGYRPDGPLTTHGDHLEQVDEPARPEAPAPLALADELLTPSYALPHDTAYAEDSEGGYGDEYDERRSPLLWFLAAVLVVALVGAAWWYLVRDDGSDGAARGSDDPGRSAPSEPAGVDVAGRASVEAPETAPPNLDVNGDQVAYDASNMLDGVPETAWRANGDGTGLALKLTLREPTTLTQVGLINGYAKTSTDDKSRTFDWYAGNRRITEVVWVFEGGVKVRQPLTETRDLQLLDLPDPVTTSKVVLRIFSVSAPGDGTASRDFTAISEVSLTGVPQEG